jgi:YHS domain-containing protein
MAHRSNVIPVKQQFDVPQDFPEKVKDPVCGAEIDRKSARHALFRAEATYYFCSKDCMQKFTSPRAAQSRQAAS